MAFAVSSARVAGELMMFADVARRVDDADLLQQRGRDGCRHFVELALA